MQRTLSIIICILLVFNLGLNVAQLFSNNSEIPSSTQSVQEILQEQKAINDYTKMIGEKYLQVIDDKVQTSSYNYKSIVGTVVNNSDKAVENIYVNVAVYKNGEIIDYTGDVISKIPAHSKMSFDVYMSDTPFDSYVIEEITGIIYE